MHWKDYNEVCELIADVLRQEAQSLQFRECNEQELFAYKFTVAILEDLASRFSASRCPEL